MAEPAPSVYASADWHAFVRRIREAPADDAPRLIAADWLEERGEESRAEFIRHQINRPEPVGGDRWDRIFSVICGFATERASASRLQRNAPGLQRNTQPD